jgi:hypothetical protein
MKFALWSSPNHIPIKPKGPIKKTSHLRPTYRRGNLRCVVSSGVHESMEEMWIGFMSAPDESDVSKYMQLSKLLSKYLKLGLFLLYV